MESVREARLEKEWFEIYLKRLGYLSDVVSAQEASLGRRTAMTEIQACFLDLAQRSPFQELIDAPSKRPPWTATDAALAARLRADRGPRRGRRAGARGWGNKS